MAAADFDRDGRIDLVIANNNHAPTILMNRLATPGRWVELELEGRRSNRDAVGARVKLIAGGRTMIRTVQAGSGYAAQSAHPLHFGLAQATEIEALEVRWPSGVVEQHAGEALRTLVVLDGRTRLIEEDGDAAADRDPAREEGATDVSA